MTTAGVILVLLSVLCAGVALLYQRSDHVKGYGSTMGGEMTAGAIWSLAAILAGTGTGILSAWYWGIATFLAVYAASFKIRGVLESTLMGSRMKGG